MPHLYEKRYNGHITSRDLVSPSRIRNFLSFVIHDTLWAYPSVTQLKNLMLLFHFIPHLAVDDYPDALFHLKHVPLLPRRLGEEMNLTP